MMLKNKLKIVRRSLFLFSIAYACSCVTAKDDTMEKKIQQQLIKIDSLLKSEDFSLLVARSQDTAYYTGIGAAVPPFLSDAEDNAFISKSAKEEKIAINLAGFYALECGLALLCNQTHENPTVWLQKIIAGKTDTATILLLNRFANATWKAGQPFRGLNRITRPNFTGAGFLPAAEIEKDHNQIQQAATKLMDAMTAVKDSGMTAQQRLISNLLHSQPFAIEMASHLAASYYTSLGQTPPPFLSKAEDTAKLRKSVKEEKIATNVAGFYALECGINYLVTTRNVLPSHLLQSITNNTISKEDKDLLSRFANATWKAGQPFRGLSRIERDTFTPFCFLSEAAIEKDWVQIKAAAVKLQAAL